MISNERLDKCINYLAETDQPYAKAKSFMLGIEHQKNTILGVQQLESDLKAVANKRADAYTSKAFEEWRREYRDAVYDFEILKNKRVTATLIIDVWRSEFSARKQGIVL